jgi:OmpA-OmpF porin, OOP family
MKAARRSLCRIVVLLVSAGLPAAAFEPELPIGARLTAERISELDSFEAPVAVFDGASVPVVTLEGRIIRRSWRVNSPGLTPLQVMVPVREQLVAQGYDLVFECAAKDCGGFDFRFSTEVLPGPNMYVNISRYRYLTALRGNRDAPREAVGVLSSTTADSAYVQIITADTDVDLDEVVPAQVQAPLDVPTDAPVDPETDTGAFEQKLVTQGHIILQDLDFATGTSDLGPGPFASLTELAAVLRARRDWRLALVGHTDVVGGLETNIAISRARARSVRDRLVSEHGVDGERLDAEGMGYLAPIASNLTEEGRALNRRVEAVLINSE